MNCIFLCNDRQSFEKYERLCFILDFFFFLKSQARELNACTDLKIRKQAVKIITLYGEYKRQTRCHVLGIIIRSGWAIGCCVDIFRYSCHLASWLYLSVTLPLLVLQVDLFSMIVIMNNFSYVHLRLQQCCHGIVKYIRIFFIDGRYTPALTQIVSINILYYILYI